MWLPSLTWSLAIWTVVSQSPSNSACLNFREPLELVRSPIMMNEVAVSEPSSWNGWNE